MTNDNAERVRRDLRAEGRNPDDYSIAGIVRDLLRAATRPDQLDSAPDIAWTNALERHQHTQERNEDIKRLAEIDMSAAPKDPDTTENLTTNPDGSLTLASPDGSNSVTISKDTIEPS